MFNWFKKKTKDPKTEYTDEEQKIIDKAKKIPGSVYLGPMSKERLRKFLKELEDR